MQLREKSSNISPVYRVNRRGMYDTPARMKPFFINNSRQAPTPANLNISLNYTIGWHEKVHDTQVPSSKITTYSETRRKNVILAKRRVEVIFILYIFGQHSFFGTKMTGFRNLVHLCRNILRFCIAFNAIENHDTEVTKPFPRQNTKNQPKILKLFLRTSISTASRAAPLKLVNFLCVIFVFVFSNKKINASVKSPFSGCISRGIKCSPGSFISNHNSFSHKVIRFSKNYPGDV